MNLQTGQPRSDVCLDRGFQSRRQAPFGMELRPRPQLTKKEVTKKVTKRGPSHPRTLFFALLALACGHTLSPCLRTLPGMSLDLMAADFATAPQTLASLIAVYYFSFAVMQIPVGAAMDRFGVR